MTVLPKKRSLDRFREITAVLARYGFGWLLSELQVRGPTPIRLPLESLRNGKPKSQAVQLRLALEELGTTFIKMGQVLSTRPDLLSPQFIVELAKLQDRVPTVEYAQIAAVIESELGAPPETIFAEFDPVPLASASIGQVHAARLPGGAEVVVKIQRPGVATTVNRDLELLLELAELIARRTNYGQPIDIVSLAQEFAFNLGCELSYQREGRNIDQFRHSFAAEQAIYIPEVYWDYTTEKVIVLERLAGLRVDDLQALDEAGIDRQRLAANSVRLMLEEMFVHGLFHADPHPGNLYILPDGRIALMDFGMVGRLDNQMQESLSHLFLALARSDSERMIDELLTTGIAAGQVNRRTLKRDLDHLITCYANQAVEDLAAAQIFSELTSLARRHHLNLPSDLVLMFKVMAISEGLGMRLDPEFQFIPFAKPYLEEYWFARHSPRELGEKVASGLIELTELGLTFPRHLKRLMAQIERGELGTQVELKGLDKLVGEMQVMVNRLAMSILVGALIVGLSQFMHMVSPDGIVQRYAGQFFGLSFVAATVLGFWLLLNLVRARRG